MNNNPQIKGYIQASMSDPADVTYAVRDPRLETGRAILAGPFIDIEDARKHQQLHLGSRVFREEFFPS